MFQIYFTDNVHIITYNYYKQIKSKFTSLTQLNPHSYHKFVLEKYDKCKDFEVRAEAAAMQSDALKSASWLMIAAFIHEVNLVLINHA